MTMRPALAVVRMLALVHGVGAMSTTGAALEAMDFCVSSRWGYSCFAPTAQKAFDFSAGLGSGLCKATRLSSRMALAGGACWLAREMARDVRNYSQEARSPKRQIKAPARSRKQPSRKMGRIIF